MVEKINGGNNSTYSKNKNPNKRAIHIHGKMEHNLAGYVNSIPMEAQKYQEVVSSQEKLITIEKIFLNIGKQMLIKSHFKLGIVA
jgi:hypothetical protein